MEQANMTSTETLSQNAGAVCLKSPQELEQLKSQPQAVGVMSISEPSDHRRSSYFQFDHLEDTN